MKAWKGTEFGGNKHTVYNTIVNQNGMNYHWKGWKDRNEKLHDESVQRKRIIDWQPKEYARPLEGQHPQVRKFEVKKMDVEMNTTEHIRMDLCSESI